MLSVVSLILHIIRNQKNKILARALQALSDRIVSRRVCLFVCKFGDKFLGNSIREPIGKCLRRADW